MGHYGKHIIDPETGLCEICDPGAIQEVRQGKMPAKQVFYSNNHDDRSTYRSNGDDDDDEIPYTQNRYSYHTHDETTPRFVRKAAYPASTVRPRRVIYEQPIEKPLVIRRRVVRREHTPPEEVVVQRLPPRPAAFYYVDDEGQMVPRKDVPPPEAPRRYIVKSRQLPPERTVHVVRRQAQTPPPPASKVWHNGPRRQLNSDTEIIERQQRTRREESDYHPPTPTPSTKPEMFHIEAELNDNDRRSPPVSPVYRSYDNTTSPHKVVRQGDHNRKQPKLEPMQRKQYNEPEPTVVRRVYKKLPPGQYEPSRDEHIPNGNHQRIPIRKSGKNPAAPPPPRQYVSSPEFSNGNNRSPVAAKNPSIYYIRSVDEY